MLCGQVLERSAGPLKAIGRRGQEPTSEESPWLLFASTPLFKVYLPGSEKAITAEMKGPERNSTPQIRPRTTSQDHTLCGDL